MRVLITALGGTLFCAFVNSATIAPSPCTKPTDCSASAYDSHCIKCLGHEGPNDPGYCSYIDRAWQTNPCSNEGYGQFCPGICSEAMAMESPFLFQDTVTAEVPSSDGQQQGSDSNGVPAAGQPVTVPTTGQSDDTPPTGQSVTVPTTGQSDDTPPTGQSVTVPTTGKPSSDSNGAPPSAQQPGEPVIVPTTQSPDNPADKTTKPTQNQPETVPSAGEIHEFQAPPQQIWRQTPTFDQTPAAPSQTPSADQSKSKSDEEITWRRRHRPHRRPETWEASTEQTAPETSSQGTQNIKVPAGDQKGGVNVAFADFGSSDDNRLGTPDFNSDAGTPGDWTQFGTS